MSERLRTTRRGIALVELLIGIAITSIIGLAMATVLISVADGLTYSREARSALQRAYAAHSRIRAYTDPSLCILDYDGKVGFAVWLHDGRENEMVNLQELRIFWFDRAVGEIIVERVEFPEEWDDVTVEAADVVLVPGIDYFMEMEAQRTLGHTVQLTLVDGMTDARLEFDALSVEDAERLRFTITVALNDEENEDILFALGIPNHRLPI